jgi:hypothetical protein
MREEPDIKYAFTDAYLVRKVISIQARLTGLVNVM